VSNSVKITFNEVEFATVKKSAGFEPLAAFCRRAVMVQTAMDVLVGDETSRSLTTSEREIPASPKGGSQNSSQPSQWEGLTKDEVSLTQETEFCDTASHAGTKRSESVGKIESGFPPDDNSAEMPTSPIPKLPKGVTRGMPEKKSKTCAHGKRSGENCWQCGGKASV
jgi:hypothetical protein